MSAGFPVINIIPLQRAVVQNMVKIQKINFVKITPFKGMSEAPKTATKRISTESVCFHPYRKVIKLRSDKIRRLVTLSGVKFEDMFPVASG